MTTNTKPRPLNMEQKRKLEKLVLADIANAEKDSQAKRIAARRVVIETLNAKPPKEARELFAAHISALAAASSAEKKLEAMGWSITGYGRKELSVRQYAPTVPTLTEFDERGYKTTAELSDLKRSYQLKVFNGETGAEQLLAMLAANLQRITS